MFSNSSSRSPAHLMAPFKRMPSVRSRLLHKYRNQYKSFVEKFTLTLFCGLITLFVFKGSSLHSISHRSPAAAIDSAAPNAAATVLTSSAKAALVNDIHSSDHGIKMKSAAEEISLLHGDTSNTSSSSKVEVQKIIEEPRPRKLMITEEEEKEYHHESKASGGHGRPKLSKTTKEASKLELPMNHQKKRSSADSDSSSSHGSLKEEAVSEEGKKTTIITPPEFKLGPTILDWDEQRKSSRSAETAAKTVTKNSMILMVTGSAPSMCKNRAGDHILLKSIKNKMDYCTLHGIQLFYNLAHISDAMSSFWSKLPLLRELMLAHPEKEWLWWMDSDALITNMKFELPIERYNGYDLVVHGWEDMVYSSKSWVGVNTGSFLLRNCQWSLDFLDQWAQMGPKGTIRDAAGKMLSTFLSDRPAFEADDQSALVYLLINHRDTLGPHVYMETKYCLHGFWLQSVHKFDQMMDDMSRNDTDHQSVHGITYYGCGGKSDGERWPFVTHFVGCKPCGKEGDGSYPLSSCLSHMERTFNFADNQIWQIYGFLHKNLNSSRLERGHLAGYQSS